MGLSTADMREIKSAIMNTFSEKFLQEIADKVAIIVNERLQEKLDIQMKAIEALQIKINKIEAENHLLGKLLDIQEQSSRNLNVRIFGLPHKNGEDVREEVLQMFKKDLNLNINSTDLKKCHRVFSKIPNNKPPAVLVRFSSDAVRVNVLKSRKQLKGGAIVIKEDLTKNRLSLLLNAVNRFTNKNVWVLNGTIYIKCDDVVHRISDADDFNKLI